MVEYEALLQRAASNPSRVIDLLGEELPHLWRDAYVGMTLHPVNIVRWRYGSFEYIFDDYASLEASGAVPHSAEAEARLVAVFGLCLATIQNAPGAVHTQEFADIRT